MTRVLVCGPRDMTDYWLVFEVLDGQHCADPITCIIEGGANGGDRFARAWSQRRGVANDPCPVDHSLDGPWPGAGPRRNWRMFKTKAPDRVIAFVATPPTPGTAHMIKVAKRAGLPVLEIMLEGDG